MISMSKFLVVYEDLWGNKESHKTNRIGDTIAEILDNYDLNLGEDVELDYEKLNSDDPYDVGSFGLGFYDISVFNNIDEDGEGNGRIMIFYIGYDGEYDEEASKATPQSYVDLKIENETLKMIKESCDKDTKHDLGVDRLDYVSDQEALEILFKFSTCNEKIDIASARWLRKQLGRKIDKDE